MKQANFFWIIPLMNLPPHLLEKLMARAAEQVRSLEALLSQWLQADENKRQTAERESLERFRLIADAAPLFIWMCDANMVMTYSNQLLIEYFDLSPK
jgi:PAS domain-containing protein